jgi:hypothetical protein
MSGCLLLIVAGIYMYVAIDQYWKGNSGVALAFFGYALSNIGLYQVSK